MSDNGFDFQFRYQSGWLAIKLCPKNKLSHSCVKLKKKIWNIRKWRQCFIVLVSANQKVHSGFCWMFKQLKFQVQFCKHFRKKFDAGVVLCYWAFLNINVCVRTSIYILFLIHSRAMLCVSVYACIYLFFPILSCAIMLCNGLCSIMHKF